ncbi:unnamed protein product [Sphenostylis stenocarpa]|uniref:Uncharacterized protein n=1 Tax=Sphenostylis stenocarpa TaxID=92480 RepID=A0AA86SFM5_9FABA|nr:unnamed protein product [Sphenostylis stenocarpa]
MKDVDTCTTEEGGGFGNEGVVGGSENCEGDDEVGMEVGGESVVEGENVMDGVESETIMDNVEAKADMNGVEDETIINGLEDGVESDIMDDVEGEVVMDDVKVDNKLVYDRTLEGTDNGDSAGDLEGNVGETKGSGDGTDDTEGNVAPGEGADAMTGDGLGLGASTGDGAEVAVGAILFVWACIFSAPAAEEVQTPKNVKEIGLKHNTRLNSLPLYLTSSSQRAQWHNGGGLERGEAVTAAGVEVRSGGWDARWWWLSWMTRGFGGGWIRVRPRMRLGLAVARRRGRRSGVLESGEAAARVLVKEVGGGL